MSFAEETHLLAIRGDPDPGPAAGDQVALSDRTDRQLEAQVPEHGLSLPDQRGQFDGTLHLPVGPMPDEVAGHQIPGEDQTPVRRRRPPDVRHGEQHGGESQYCHSLERQPSGMDQIPAGDPEPATVADTGKYGVCSGCRACMTTAE